MLQLLTRRLRRVIALGVIGALIVAQSAMAAHACSMVLSNLPLSTPSEPMVTASEDGPSFGSADGAGAPIHDENSLALCHFHCKGDPQIDAYADAPTAPIAPQPALIVILQDQRLPASAAATLLPMRSSTPPPLILLSRFLI